MWRLSFIHNVHQINELISRGNGKVKCGERAGTGVCPECEGEGLLSFGVRGSALALEGARRFIGGFESVPEMQLSC